MIKLCYERLNSVLSSTGRSEFPIPKIGELKIYLECSANFFQSLGPRCRGDGEQNVTPVVLNFSVCLHT